MARERKNRDDLASLEDGLKTYVRGMADANYRRLESLIGIYQCLDVTLPLPAMMGYAMEADTGAALVSEILAGRPRIVLELGSGVSTLLSAYAMAKIGAGHVISLEHDRRFFERTYHDLVDHGVHQWVDLVHAPLTDIELENGVWRWYDLSGVELPAGIDLLVVDGPPAHIQTRSRYPALPVLRERLADNASVLLDDAGRDDERAIVRMWAEAFSEFTIEALASVKGAVLLRRAPRFDV